jgi:RimJ/RimL family protein N-acetyltransferase
MHNYLNDPSFRNLIHERLYENDPNRVTKERDAYKHIDNIRKKSQALANKFSELDIPPELMPKTRQAPTGVNKSEDLEKGLRGDWKNEGYTFTVTHHEDHPKFGGEAVEVQAHHPQYGHVGGTLVRVGEEGYWTPSMSEVLPKHRRKGITSEMYRLAEQHLGEPLFPDYNQSRDAKKLWAQPSPPFGKSEDLSKMAIADIKPSDTGNYSHLIPEHLRNEYSIRLTEDDDADYDKALVAKIYHRGEHAGTFVGNIAGDSILTHQWMKPKHQNKKLGNAGMEALLTHAFHKFGVKRVEEHLHSLDASRVHASLSRKHGMEYKPDPLDEDSIYHKGYTIKSELIPASNDAIVHDIHKAPEQHLKPEFYRVTPSVKQAYEDMGRGHLVQNAQFISDPSPSIASSVTPAFDNDADLDSYTRSTYDPYIQKTVGPSMMPNRSIFLAPIPANSMHHGNNTPYVSIEHLHGVSVTGDKRGRVPFYFAMGTMANAAGHAHPLFAPAIAEYNHKQDKDHHNIKIIDGNGRMVSARTAGVKHMMAYVGVKPEDVHSFLRMIHKAAPSEEMKVRSISGNPSIPSEFSVHEIPSILGKVHKSESLMDTLDKVEKAFDSLKN